MKKFASGGQITAEVLALLSRGLRSRLPALATRGRRTAAGISRLRPPAADIARPQAVGLQRV